MLHFDIDMRQLVQAGQEFNATPRQVKASLARALSRTATTLRVLSARGLTRELELRRVAALRKRLKSVRLKATDGGVSLWYGLNDMPVSWFKGAPKETGGGATFKGKQFPGAFVAKSGYTKGKTVFKRTGKARLHIQEQLMPVEDKAVVFIEDEIFSRLESIFWPVFMRDLEARVKYNLGKK